MELGGAALGDAQLARLQQCPPADSPCDVQATASVFATLGPAGEQECGLACRMEGAGLYATAGVPPPQPAFAPRTCFSPRDERMLHQLGLPPVYLPFIPVVAPSYLGNDAGGCLAGKQPKDCAVACQAKSSCNAFTYNPLQNGACVALAAATAFSVAVAAASAVTAAPGSPAAHDVLRCLRSHPFFVTLLPHAGGTCCLKSSPGTDARWSADGTQMYWRQDAGFTAESSWFQQVGVRGPPCCMHAAQQPVGDIGAVQAVHCT